MDAGSCATCANTKQMFFIGQLVSTFGQIQCSQRKGIQNIQR